MILITVIKKSSLLFRALYKEVTASVCTWIMIQVQTDAVTSLYSALNRRDDFLMTVISIIMHYMIYIPFKEHILLITNYLSQLRMLRYLSSSSSSSSSSANVPSQKQCSQCKQEKEISHFISKQNEKIVTINRVHVIVIV